MEVLTMLSWIFGSLFLIFSICCGAYGCVVWRKLTLIHRMLAACRDEVRVQKLHKAGVRYTKEFKEMRWCFFLGLDFTTVFVVFLAKTNGLM